MTPRIRWGDGPLKKTRGDMIEVLNGYIGENICVFGIRRAFTLWGKPKYTVFSHLPEVGRIDITSESIAQLKLVAEEILQSWIVAAGLDSYNEVV